MFYTFTTINTFITTRKNLYFWIRFMLVNEITQITAHDWHVVHGYKRFVAAVTVHSSRALLESKRHLLPSHYSL